MSPAPGRRPERRTRCTPPTRRRRSARSTIRPINPWPDKTLYITAKVTDPDGVASVQLKYQLVNPGDYIAIDDARYNDPAQWTTATMYDDGTHGDATAADGVYTAVLPGSVANKSPAGPLPHFRHRFAGGFDHRSLMPTIRSRISPITSTTACPIGPARSSPALLPTSLILPR